MRTLISKVIRTVTDLGNFALLLLLFLYIYTLVGMQFFANRFRFDENGHPYHEINSEKWRHAENWSRSNFDDFPHSFATIFQILTTENWNSVLYDCYRSIGPVSMIFACTLIIFGDYIFMNLFLAILIGNFSNEQQEKSTSALGSASASASNSGDGDNISKYNISNNKEEEYEMKSIKTTPRKTEIKQHSHSPKSPNSPNYSPRNDSCKSNGNNNNSSNNNTSLHNKRPSQRKKSAIKTSKIVPTTISPKSSELNRGINEDQKVEDINQTISQLVSDNTNLQSTMIINQPTSQEEGYHELQMNENQQNKDQEQDKDKDQNKDKDQEREQNDQEQNEQHEQNEGEESETDDEDDEEEFNEHSEQFASKSYDKSVHYAEVTLGIFKTTNPIRKFCVGLISNPNFDRFVLVLIFISSITLAIENPLLNPESQLSISLDVIDIILTVLFTIEMIIKIIALGLVMHPTAYLRSYWNCLDCFVVGISYAGLLSGSKSLISLRSLRSLRGLRPLRVINRAPGLKLVVNAVLASIPDVMNVAALCFLFFLIFSIFGVNYFKGQLRGCTGSFFHEYIEDIPEYMKILTYPKQWKDLNDIEKSYFGPNSTIPLNCNSFNYPNEPCCNDYKLGPHVTSKMICECWGAEWDLLGSNNFDNVGMALLTLFQMSTTEGWVTLMYQLVDTSDVNMQPIRDNRLEWIFFSIFFILISSYLTLNLFVGVVIENFNRMKLKLDGNLGFFNT